MTDDLKKQYISSNPRPRSQTYGPCIGDIEKHPLAHLVGKEKYTPISMGPTYDSDNLGGDICPFSGVVYEDKGLVSILTNNLLQVIKIRTDSLFQQHLPENIDKAKTETAFFEFNGYFSDSELKNQLPNKLSRLIGYDVQLVEIVDSPQKAYIIEKKVEE